MIRKGIFNNLLSRIDDELLLAETNNLIKVRPYNDDYVPDREYIEEAYKANTKIVSLYETPAQAEIVFNTKLIDIECYYHRWFMTSHKYSNDEIRAEIKTQKEGFYASIDIFDFIRKNIDYMRLYFTQEVEELKKSEFFPCIEDVNIILKEMYEYYTEILESKDKQIQYFSGLIRLNKPVSDLITRCLLRLIEEIALMKNNRDIISKKTEQNESTRNEGYYKLEWLGKQKELVELFVELEKKEWIPKSEPGSIRGVSESIVRLFDLSRTKRFENSDVVNSFAQAMKGRIRNGVKSYDSIFGKRYSRKFDEIKMNGKAQKNIFPPGIEKKCSK